MTSRLRRHDLAVIGLVAAAHHGLTWAVWIPYASDRYLAEPADTLLAWIILILAAPIWWVDTNSLAPFGAVMAFNSILWSSVMYSLWSVMVRNRAQESVNLRGCLNYFVAVGAIAILLTVGTLGLLYAAADPTLCYLCPSCSTFHWGEKWVQSPAHTMTNVALAVLAGPNLSDSLACHRNGSNSVTGLVLPLAPMSLVRAIAVYSLWLGLRALWRRRQAT